LTEFFPEIFSDQKNRVAFDHGYYLFNFDRHIEQQKHVA
jgi:hypothetical protein